jgi:DNA invertase Pin-like site-specific DNA recombinase
MLTKRAISVQGPTRVVGYIRVSTDEQVESGAGLEAQRRAIIAAADSRGYELVRIYEDAGVSGKSLNGRPGLLSALQSVESGETGALVVARPRCRDRHAIR